MKPYILGKLFTLMTLAVLFLAACQPAAPEATNPAVGTATQMLGAEPSAPATEPAETAAPVEATEANVQATPTGDSSELPSTGVQAPEGWQVLNDSTRGYSLAHPAEWRSCQETMYSRVFCADDPAWMDGTALRLYISVIPQDFTNAPSEAYNFYPTESIREFMALPVGDSMLKEPGAMAPEYFTYTRLPDRMVAGWNALMIENSKVWEMPPGTKDRVVFIVTEGTTYMPGMYYNTPEQLAMFEQVLDSLQFVP